EEARRAVRVGAGFGICAGVGFGDIGAKGTTTADPAPVLCASHWPCCRSLLADRNGLRCTQFRIAKVNHLFPASDLPPGVYRPWSLRQWGKDNRLFSSVGRQALPRVLDAGGKPRVKRSRSRECSLALGLALG